MNPQSAEDPISLRQKLSRAKAEYQKALAEYRRLMGVSADCSNLVDASFVDGNHAMRKAIAIHRHARLKYEQALRDFTEFVLSRTQPGNHVD